MFLMLFWGHTLVINKSDLGKFLPKIVKWFTPTIKDKKVTYPNSSLKNYEQRENIPLNLLVKSYKKSPVFFVAKTLKEDIRNCSLKLTKVFSQ